jgi:hypothetical protein
VWRASYLPFGEGPTITGHASLNARFPGRWFMAETGFLYNLYPLGRLRVGSGEYDPDVITC